MDELFRYKHTVFLVFIDTTLAILENSIDNPLSTSAPVAQLDRVPGYEPGGRGFESCLAHQPVFLRAISKLPQNESDCG